MKVSLSAATHGLQGHEGTVIERDLNGRQKIVSFMPLKLPGLDWVVLAHMDLHEALAPVYRFRSEAILWSSKRDVHGQRSSDRCERPKGAANIHAHSSWRVAATERTTA